MPPNNNSLVRQRLRAKKNRLSRLLGINKKSNSPEPKTDPHVAQQANARVKQSTTQHVSNRRPEFRLEKQSSTRIARKNNEANKLKLQAERLYNKISNQLPKGISISDLDQGKAEALYRNAESSQKDSLKANIKTQSLMQSLQKAPSEEAVNAFNDAVQEAELQTQAAQENWSDSIRELKELSLQIERSDNSPFSPDRASAIQDFSEESSENFTPVTPPSDRAEFDLPSLSMFSDFTSDSEDNSSIVTETQLTTKDYLNLKGAVRTLLASKAFLDIQSTARADSIDELETLTQHSLKGIEFKAKHELINQTLSDIAEYIDGVDPTDLDTLGDAQLEAMIDALREVSTWASDKKEVLQDALSVSSDTLKKATNASRQLRNIGADDSNNFSTAKTIGNVGTTLNGARISVAKLEDALNEVGNIQTQTEAQTQSNVIILADRVIMNIQSKLTDFEQAPLEPIANGKELKTVLSALQETKEAYLDQLEDLYDYLDRCLGNTPTEIDEAINLTENRVHQLFTQKSTRLKIALAELKVATISTQIQPKVARFVDMQTTLTSERMKLSTSVSGEGLRLSDQLEERIQKELSDDKLLLPKIYSDDESNSRQIRERLVSRLVGPWQMFIKDTSVQMDAISALLKQANSLQSDVVKEVDAALTNERGEGVEFSREQTEALMTANGQLLTEKQLYRQDSDLAKLQDLVWNEIDTIKTVIEPSSSLG